MNTETMNPAPAEQGSSELQRKQEVMREAVRLMERLSDATFTFIDPASGMLVHEGRVVDLKNTGSEWVATIQDGADARLVEINLGHLRNVELMVEEASKLSQ